MQIESETVAVDRFINSPARIAFVFVFVLYQQWVRPDCFVFELLFILYNLPVCTNASNRNGVNDRKANRDLVLFAAADGVFRLRCIW